MALFGKRAKEEHSDDERKLAFDPAQTARLLPILVLLLGGLGLWCLGAGGLRMRDDARHANLEQARDDAVASVRRALNDQRQQLSKRLQSGAFKDAVAAGNTANAVAALKQDWSEVKRAEVWPANLDALYAALPRSGFGTIAAAEAALSRTHLDEGAPPLAPCLFDPDWHPGVVGLVASKIKERLHRPVIAFAPAEPGSTVLRGSARSIPGFHIRDALAAIDAANPGLMQRFGGHAMAAGLSLDESALSAFREAFHEQASKLLDEAMLQEVLLSDGELRSDELDRGHAEALRGAGPWGQGFPEPMFDGRFDVLDWRVIGEKHLKFSLRLPGHAAALNAIHFNGWQDQAPPARIHAAYQLDTDDWQNRRGIQLLIRYWQAAE